MVMRMLDVPFADEDRVFDGLGLSEGEAPVYAFAWHPKLILLPTWQLDMKARFLKRLIDLVFAATALIVLAVPALFVMLAIRVDSPGPVLFRQRRIGLRGRPFTALKFRTMRWDRLEPKTIRQATRYDSRVTRVGHWLRPCSLDELPQLINVLAGEMSIVGPRPHAPGTRAGGHLFEEVTQCYGSRHIVKPGLTAEMLDASRLLAMGLVSRVVPDTALVAETMKLAGTFAAGPRIAYRYIKRNIKVAEADTLSDALDSEAFGMLRCRESADHAEAARAFVEKRPPVFTGR